MSKDWRLPEVLDLANIRAIRTGSQAKHTLWMILEPAKDGAEAPELFIGELDRPYMAELAVVAINRFLWAWHERHRRGGESLHRSDADVDALVGALRHIREHLGQVCPEFDVCTHPGCHASYAAWATADAALKAIGAE